MSHYTVVVIGGFVEQQLAPFDESIDVAPYFTPDSWIEQEGKDLAKKRGYDSSSLDDIIKALNEEYPDDGAEFCTLDGKIGRMTNYNPDSKWDWYVIGGRWRGFFPLRPDVEYDISALGEPGTFERMDGDFADYAKERRVDIALKSQIDFEAARNKAEEQGRELFEKWKKLFLKYGKPKSWTEIRESVAHIDDARILYRDQPAIAKAGKELKFWMDCPVEVLGFDEEAYASKCRNNALVPYSVLKNGIWYSKGKMGWWGMSSDDMTDEQWAARVHELYDSLPDNMLLTLVDCHI